MQLLNMNKSPQCLIYSAAMVFDVSPKVICDYVGATGLEQWWPQKKYPKNLRGIHIQEIIDFAWSIGKSMVSIDVDPMITPDVPELAKHIINNCEERIERYLAEGRALIICPNHAVAWDGKEVYDPNGFITAIDNYRVMQIYLISDQMGDGKGI